MTTATGCLVDPFCILTSTTDGSSIFVQAYLVKLDAATGATAFARAFVGDTNLASHGPQLPAAVATSTSGDAIVVVGGWLGLVVLNEDGVYQWDQTFDTGDTQAVLPEAVAVDSGGNVIVAGGYSGNVDFGNGSKNAGAATDAFVVKFNSTGVYQWDAAYGDGSAQSAFALATDDQDDILVAGNYLGLIDLGNGDLPNPDVATLNVFVAKLAEADGATQWSRGYGDAADQVIGGCVSGFDESYCLGTFAGAMDFGVQNLTEMGENDVWLAQFAK
jgi:hypothetical protein